MEIKRYKSTIRIRIHFNTCMSMDYRYWLKKQACDGILSVEMNECLGAWVRFDEWWIKQHSLGQLLPLGVEVLCPVLWDSPLLRPQACIIDLEFP